MTPALALLVLSGVALVCATTAYVVRLLIADRSMARARLAQSNDGELVAIREKVEVLGKQVSEHKAILASNAARGVRK